MEELYFALLEVGMQEHRESQMDDLLREINKLSANGKYNKSEDSISSKEEIIVDTSSTKKLPRKRQKIRNKKDRGRKRQLKYIHEEAGSSSYTDCNDEEILRDYIENITANLSSSDTDITLRKGAFLVKRDFATSLGYPNHIHPEVDETDSFSESFLLTHSRKKRRKNKNKKHSMEVIHQSEIPPPHFDHDSRAKLDQVLKQQYSRPTAAKTSKKMRFDCGDADKDIDMDAGIEHNSSQDSSLANTSSDGSDTSTNSNSPGSEADDEGEESCVETGSSIKPVIPWWDHQQETRNSLSEQDLMLEQTLCFIKGKSDFSPRYTNINDPMNVLFECGGFVAYANYKIKKFVLNRDSHELSLYTTSRKERTQISHLAALYELQSSIEAMDKSNKVILTKTGMTKDADQQALKLFLSRELKLRWRKNRPLQKLTKRRKINPNSILDDSSFQESPMDIPVADTNIGHQMLKGMGWKPGQGLGKDGSGVIIPIKPIKRPRNLGFGHPDIS